MLSSRFPSDYKTHSKYWTAKYDAGVPENPAYDQIPIHNLLRQAVQNTPEQPFVIFQGLTLSYARVEALSNQLAASLVWSGLQKGERVGLLIPNTPQFLIALFGVFKAGGVAVPAAANAAPHELTAQWLQAGVTRAIVFEPMRPIIENAAVPGLHNVVYTAPADVAVLARPRLDPAQHLPASFLGLIAAGQDLPVPDCEVSGDDPACMAFTGGASGTPKLVVGKHRHLTAAALMYNHWMTPFKDGSGIFLMALPLSHVFGLANALIGMSLRAALVLAPNPRAIDDIVCAIDQAKANYMPATPNMLAALINCPKVQQGECSLKSLRIVLSGAVLLPAPIRQRFEALISGRVIEAYGASEVFGAISSEPQVGERRLGSVGLPLPGVELRIVDLEDGRRICAAGEQGEVVFRSPHLFESYYNNPEETAQALQDGWFYTGDIGYLDEDGFLFLIDRKKDVIKPGGRQVWPAEVEQALLSHAAVQDAGVARIPDPQFGEAVAAWVVLKPGQATAPDELIRWCKERLAGYKTPRQVQFVDALPRSPAGKLLRRDLN